MFIGQILLNCGVGVGILFIFYESYKAYKWIKNELKVIDTLMGGRED